MAKKRESESSAAGSTLAKKKTARAKKATATPQKRTARTATKAKLKTAAAAKRAVKAAAKTRPPGASTAPPSDPAADQEAIARLAYRFWEQRGRPHGSPEQDWYRAEQEMLGVGLT